MISAAPIATATPARITLDSASATRINRTETPAKVSGSAARIPKSWLTITRVAASATGTPIASGGFEEDVEFALRLGRADALVLTGKSYAETLHMVTTVRAQYAEAPIVVGGGVTAENFGELARVADGAIVSTSMKGTGSAVGRIVPEKVKAFMTAARNARATAA